MEPKKTSLYPLHVAAGAKMVEFAGYSMPIQYRGIIDEHRAVRQSLGLFDVSHMGEFEIHGRGALDFLQKVTINDVARLDVNQAQYTAMCYEDGGIVDDLIVYRTADHYEMVVNASNLDKDWQWLQSHAGKAVELVNKSEQTGLLALQGRHAEAALQTITSIDLAAIKYYWFALGEVSGAAAMVTRTGYTGEDGFEIMVPMAMAPAVWQAIMAAGAKYGIEPIGLGARDTLRMEMKYCLYGNDIDQSTNPIEAGLGWITKLEKGDFIGAAAIRKVKEAKPARKLVGMLPEGRSIARHGHEIFAGEQRIGHVTSGGFSPSLSRPIAIGYVQSDYAAPGTAVTIQIRNQQVPAQVVKTPFYQRPY